MSLQDLPWSAVPHSARITARGALRPAKAARPSGALRYRCPITGSYVLVTDEATLAWLDRPQARLRCADCGDLHLIDSVADAIPSGAAA